MRQVVLLKSLVVDTAQVLPPVLMSASECPYLCAPGPVGLRHGGGGAHSVEGRRGDQRESTKGEGEG